MIKAHSTIINSIRIVFNLRPRFDGNPYFQNNNLSKRCLGLEFVTNKFEWYFLEQGMKSSLKKLKEKVRSVFKNEVDSDYSNVNNNTKVLIA